MKSLFVILLLTVAAAEAQQERQRCIAKSQFMQACNTCFCDDDGYLMGCTLMACNPNEWNADGTRKDPLSGLSLIESKTIAKRSASARESVWTRSCEPGKSFKYYCNSCTCNKDGRVGRCTRMLCDERIFNEDGSLKINDKKEKKCEAGKAYSPDGCNTCICNEYGSGSICTSRRCSLNSIQTHTDKKIIEWGPLYKQGDRCTPNELFYSECNKCICSRYGRSALCTTSKC